MIEVNLEKLNAYGDRLGDGAVQLSFTLPVFLSEEAKAAAKLYAEKMGLKEVHVAHMEAMGRQFTFFVVYAKAPHSINFNKVKVPKIKTTYMDFKNLTKFMETHIEKPLIVLGACTGSDAHTVGIDAIFNMKGFDMDYGLERYPLIDAHNLRSQVDNVHLVESAEKMGADAILVSQIVTQRGIHLKNLGELKRAILKSKNLKPHLITIIGGPKIDHSVAKKLGFDAGFGPGTRPSQVASFIVDEFLKRTGKGGLGAEPEKVEGEEKKKNNNPKRRHTRKKHPNR